MHARLQKEPDNLAAQRLSAHVLAARGEFAEATQGLRKIAEDGRASTEDLNSFAWSALFLPSVPSDAVEAAERGNTITQNQQFPILHTLACLYAETGKTVEARNLLIKALDSSRIGEPNSALWYGFGRLAELYGQYDAALDDYKRVETPEIDDAFATYNLTQHRVQALKAKGSTLSAAN